MVDFQAHTPEAAPADSKAMLEQTKKGIGMIPNLLAVMAESPQMLKAYKVMGELFSTASLNKTECHVVWLTINTLNECHYCVPAHRMLALKDSVPIEVVDAVCNDDTLEDAKLEALRLFTKEMVLERGQADEATVEAFIAAGYTKANILDVILGISHKILSNYTNAMAKTEIDAPFKKFIFERDV